jgi:hypothetical protein
MRKWILLLVLLPFCMGCSKRTEKNQTAADFETLMGKNYPAWQFVQTPEDFENLAFFKKLYERNIPRLAVKSQMVHIPKVIHFIWIGPKPFPLESTDNVRSWIARHPDWTFKFWTDRDRPLPHPKMQKMMIPDLKFLKLYECYKKSDNYGEKSDLLRYEILNQEGGIYVDHDVKCIKSFEAFNQAYDFFCGMELPYKTALSSSVLPTNNTVGARPGHPIIKHCMEWLAANWDRLEEEYPGKDRESVINRISHRTFFAFADSVRTLADKEGNHDIAFPTFYFNAPDEAHAIYSRHLYQGSWFENESVFEKAVRERLMKISKKTNKILLFFGVMSLINVMGFSLLFMKYRKLMKNA